MRTLSRLSILGALAALALSAVPAQAQDTQPGSFTLSTQPNGDGTLTPTLTWETDAASCVASGDAEWEGAKAGSGTQTLSPRPTTQPRSFALVCSSADETTALLTWQAPTTNTDGSTLTNLAGYRVHWGTVATALTQTAQIDNPAATSYSVSNLTPGTTYHFGVRAFTTQGAESSMSNLVSKTPRAGVEWSQQTGFKVPGAPVTSVE